MIAWFQVHWGNCNEFQSLAKHEPTFCACVLDWMTPPANIIMLHVLLVKNLLSVSLRAQNRSRLSAYMNLATNLEAAASLPEEVQDRVVGPEQYSDFQTRAIGLPGHDAKKSRAARSSYTYPFLLNSPNLLVAKHSA